MAIKKVLLQKKIDGALYDIYQKTSADIVEYNGSTVAAQLATFASDLETISKDNGTIDAKVKAASDALYNKIMGFTDSETTINQAYDTLKEVADYLTAHGDVVNGFTTDISALKKTVGDDNSGLIMRVTTTESSLKETKTMVDANGGLIADNMKRIKTLETTVGDSDEGTGIFGNIKSLQTAIDTNRSAIQDTISDVGKLKNTVGNESGGLVKDVADNAAAIKTLQEAATKVTKSEKNGYVTVDGADVLVYDDSAIAATKIVEDDTHKFCTKAEKEAYAAAAKVIVATEAPAILDEKDLLMLVIG